MARWAEHLHNESIPASTSLLVFVVGFHVKYAPYLLIAVGSRAAAAHTGNGGVNN